MQSVKLEDLYRAMGEWAPWDTAEDWDNVGVLVQGAEENITGVCCTLDITPEAVVWAAQNKCNLLLSHHPVIFRPMKMLAHESVPAQLIRHGITALCAHTNLDKARGGVCETLAEKIGLQNICPSGDFVYLGELDRTMELSDFARKVRKSLSAPVCWVDGGASVRTVAVVSGAGGDFWPQAQAAGAECLVTGELRHHEALDAQQAGMSVIAATHYGTEKWIVPVMADRIRRLFPELFVCQWDCPEAGISRDSLQYEL